MPNLRAFLGPARTLEEAEQGLRVTALGCYPFAALALACGLSKVPHVIPLASALMLPTFFIAAAYFLPRRASRTFACFLLGYGLVFTAEAGAIGIRFTLFGVIDLVFSVLAIWIGVQAVRLTFTYHRLLGTRIQWENVRHAWGWVLATILFTIVFLAAMIRQHGWDSAVAETILFGVILLSCIEFFVVQTQRRPLAIVDPVAKGETSSAAEGQVAGRDGDSVAAMEQPSIGMLSEPRWPRIFFIFRGSKPRRQ